MAALYPRPVDESGNGHGRPETEAEHDERMKRAVMDEARRHLDPEKEREWLDSLVGDAEEDEEPGA